MSVIKFIRDIERYFKYPSDDNPTTQQDYQNAVRNWVAAEANLVDCILWQPTTMYSVGNVVKTPSLPSQQFLVCATAGTSGSAEPSYSGKTVGSSVTDGSVTWMISSYALTDSPAFTGTPTAPTPNNGDNSYKIATTAYVKSCIPKSTGNSTTPVYVDSNGNFVAGQKYVSASVLGTVKTEANNTSYSISGAEHQLELYIDEGTWVVTAHARFTGVQSGKRYGIELSKVGARVNDVDETCVIVHSSGTGSISLVTTGVFTMTSSDTDGINLNAYASAEATISYCRIRAVRIK